MLIGDAFRLCYWTQVRGCSRIASRILVLGVAYGVRVGCRAPSSVLKTNENNRPFSKSSAYPCSLHSNSYWFTFFNYSIYSIKVHSSDTGAWGMLDLRC